MAPNFCGRKVSYKILYLKKLILGIKFSWINFRENSERHPKTQTSDGVMHGFCAQHAGNIYDYDLDYDYDYWKYNYKLICSGMKNLQITQKSQS